MPALNYQRRGVAQSPSQAQLQVHNESILAGANHFHNRNQSMDVVNSNKIKQKLQNRKRAVLEQPLDDPGQQSAHDDHGSATRGQERFKPNNNASRGGNDYL